VGSVTGQEMGGSGDHRGEKDHLIARRQHQPLGEDRRSWYRHDLALTDERVQAPDLIVPDEIVPCLFYRVRGREQSGVSKAPENE